MRDLLNDLEAGKHLSDPDPVKRTRNQMKAPQAKRFYQTVSVAGAAGGFAIHLDGKPVRTPARTMLVLPTDAAARLIAAEFDAQADTIVPVTMPVLRLVNTAIDGVANDPQAVLEDILRFASSDLVCYRAEAPRELVERQAAIWDPVVDWAHQALAARFILAEGVMHVDQPREAIAAIGIHLRQRSDPLRLAALHVMTSLSGSALLALAAEAREFTPGAAWMAAHVDEDWNAEHWGEDHEAAARKAARRRDFMGAAALLEALRDSA